MLRVPILTPFAFLWLVPLAMNLHAKCDVSTSNSSRDMEGILNLKSRSRDPFPTSSDLILHFVLAPLVMNLHAKFDVSS